MNCNMGTTDRIIRLIIGAVVAVLGFYYKSWWGLLAVIPLITAAIGFCPLYIPFKISTIRKK